MKLEKYAAKLLFQWRIMVDNFPGTMRLCEERIINLRATSGKEALRLAKSHGKKAQYSNKNSHGNPVHFEFVGIMDLQHLGIECSRGEVWYNIATYKKPMERKQKLIPAENKLCAIFKRKPSRTSRSR